MDLDEFISETLGQILSGIAKAQGTDIGKNVNAAFPGVLGSNLSALPEFGVFARVDFDVAVTAETSVGGKGSIRVWGIGAEGGKDSKSQTVSRVVFAVPLRLPDGDQSKQIAADAAEAERKRKLLESIKARPVGGPEGWMAR
ncbi:hypothetical protein NKH47_14765 [Mesorhizobium sp. M1060]|uniref:trypco2 family protein n=1 Tax=unclassified Mesorhizobium TaxID=325217 RepID=UPI0003CEAD31|nr:MULTISPECIES: trypco2 family protein [unclassified Mesorhizobium]ESW88667.1 hypothetical protein X770_15490 [Mesorhizobium sp. LSJC269B00]ESX50424.1 hypothetical protein X762_08880 [Mesorhizobium sp. LSHC426A00]ESX57861.1 hypothetical protein X761_07795 [Mesorhizobium sp. LSHC424B00]ESX75402.1 hypothetical protein X758_04165 [Mesorhizobium sp. LSHC416B00]ESZ07224.1 hypothetical protein X736_12785 [Mesorhizobium sp. L2C089B000]